MYIRIPWELYYMYLILNNMRKFTKEHNDLDWLFPVLDKDSHWERPEDTYDKYEDIGFNLLQAAHGQHGSPRDFLYNTDDLMDAFMKGASVARQYTLTDIENKIECEVNKRLLEKSKNVEEQLKIALKLIEHLKNK